MNLLIMVCVILACVPANTQEEFNPGANLIIKYSIEVGPKLNDFDFNKSKLLDNNEWLVNPNFTINDTLIPTCPLDKNHSLNVTNYTTSDVILTFLVAGDTGGDELPPYTSKVGRDTAAAMGNFAQKYKPKFVVLVGDNFYPRGVSSIDDPRFNTSFENLFNHSDLNIPWYILAGGHDHYGNMTAQLLYKSTKWNFPGLLYTKTFDIPLPKGMNSITKNNLKLEIVMIDTQVMCPTQKYLKKAYEKGKYLNAQNKEFMWRKLEEILANSTADVLIVAGHQPIYSVAKHGPTPCLTRRLKPLLYKYNVTLYLSGHDHVLEHLRDRNGTNNQMMEYAVVGSGSKLNVNRRQDRVTSPLCLEKFFYDQKGGFGIVDILVNGTLRMTFMNSDNTLLHQFNITRRISKK